MLQYQINYMQIMQQPRIQLQWKQLSVNKPWLKKIIHTWSFSKDLRVNLLHKVNINQEVFMIL